MIIYGVALLAICTLAGVIMGDMLGVLLGVKSNVGGVGIAMILLICARLWMQKRATERGHGLARRPGGGAGGDRLGGGVRLHHCPDQPDPQRRTLAR